MVGSFVHIMVHQHCFSSLMPIALNRHKDMQQHFMKIRIGLTHSSCSSFRIAGILVAEGGRGFTRGFTAADEEEHFNAYEYTYDLVPHNCIFNAERLLKTGAHNFLAKINQTYWPSSVASL